MPESQRSIVLAVALIAVAVLAGVSASGVRLPVLPQDPAEQRAQRLRDPRMQAAGFTYDGSVSPTDRQDIEAAVAAARPEARRLIDVVDGLTTIRVVGLGDRTAGLARPTPDGYELALDLAGVRQSYGVRGISRLVLHEIGHVVDDALLDQALRAQLDEAIPPGYPCDPGVPEGSCAPQYERFAETFAKWATGDIGVDVYLGYKVPPPALDTWGEPLARLQFD